MRLSDAYAAPLGLSELQAQRPEPHRIAFQPDDQILIYTDGVIEARDRRAVSTRSPSAYNCWREMIRRRHWRSFGWISWPMSTDPSRTMPRCCSCAAGSPKPRRTYRRNDRPPSRRRRRSTFVCRPTIPSREDPNISQRR
ncbi:SpoIIE family protein phosphatase [Nonomuraea basaltis]|uniref:SpoIIE family protein phosphatase n=1 Tax=Nonomuraea basaltis TaxID=2495887 RepID=UPI0019820E96|nr:SpoIIE family protein phosphatase [Nonomuraea basaltis]